MELDRRIIKGKKPLDCYDTQEAKDYIDKYCYFSNQLEDFSDLDIFTDECAINHDRHIGVLKRVSDSLFEPFKMRDVDNYYGSGDFTYILPMEWLNKEKSEQTYRPYNMSEFKSEFKINTVLTLRKRKEHDYVYQTVYLGNRHYDDTDSDENHIYLSQGVFSLRELFNIFEIVRNGDWQPFGVLDNSIKEE